MIEELIEQIRRDLRAGRFSNEAAVSQGIVLPLLNELKWPVFNTQCVAPEYSLEGRRVDFALCDGGGRPRVFVEVKRVGQSEGGDRQLFEYAFHRGVPMAVLTAGQEWSFYLPGEEGHYEERRVYKLDLLERDPKECAERLNRYLNYERVVSGDALESARNDYKDATKVRLIKSTLPKAWSELIESQDTLLSELLADKVEDMCGYKPDQDTCARFLSELSHHTVMVPLTSHRKATTTEREIQRSQLLAPNQSYMSYTFNGKTYQAHAAREVMREIFRLFADRDHSFLGRFAARKHGKKRRYIAQDRAELYPGRLDLCEHSMEIIPGWWIGTNYSKRSIEEIIRLACEVADVTYGKEVKINLGT